MNETFLKYFRMIYRPKGLLTRDPGEPPETFEELHRRAVERDLREGTGLFSHREQPDPVAGPAADPSAVRRDIEGLGDNELAAGRPPAVPPRRVNPLAAAMDATPAGPNPAARRRQDPVPSSGRAADPLAPAPERHESDGPSDEIETAMTRNLPGQRRKPPGFEHPGPVTGRGSPRPAPVPKLETPMPRTIGKGENRTSFGDAYAKWWNSDGRKLAGERARGRKIEPSESFFWKNLPSSRPIKGRQTRWNGQTGKKSRHFQWDHKHGEIEVFGPGGKHLGAMDPVSGRMIKGPNKKYDIPVRNSSIDDEDPKGGNA